MTYKKIVAPEKHIGRSTDTKPTHQRPGSTALEYDSQTMMITPDDGTTWVEKKDTTNSADINWRFGQPELRHDNEGWGQWESKALQAKFKDSYDTNRQFRYGNWAVHLNGGPQASGESWASVSVPINDMPIPAITSIAYDWYAHQAGSSHILDIGPNLVWSAYDPADHSKRADFNTYAVDNNLFMADGLANRPIEAGWYRFIMTSTDTTERVYWYGDNDGTHDTAPAEGADGYWSQIITDVVFKTWVVYRVQIMIGYWSSTRSTGDVWIGNLRINDISVRWEPSEADRQELLEKEENMFGLPELRYEKNSRAYWSRGSASPRYQKSSTGWQACLHGRVQTGDDWAGCFIPINEMHVPDLKTALWSYYMSASDSFGVNMVIWVHDPFNFDNRAEITQRQQHASLIKAAGWNAHVLNPSTDYFFFWGENTTKTNLVAGTDYGWDDFVADELFNTWTIYRISYEFGWQASGTFGYAWLAGVEINGRQIPLKPRSDADLAPIHDLSETTAATFAFTVAPKTPFQLLSLDLHAGASLAGTNLTITKDAGADGSTNSAWFDTVIYSYDIATSTATSHYHTFEGKEAFSEDDELDIAQSNTGTQDIGCDVCWKPL